MATELQYYSKHDLSRFAGEWIAILDNEVISNGKVLKDVYAEANSKAKGKKPFFIRVPEFRDEMIL
ncbi:MAG: DUF5678 domain-containing protein [Nitrososphaerales archaeon]